MPVPPHVPELATLDVLLTVARAGSMNAAARDLGMSQQAVSARVHAAEREMSLTVFRRSAAGVEPTAEGVLILEWASSVLEQAERLSVGVSSLLGHRNTSLDVAASMTIAEFLVPEWVVALRRSSPDVRVRVRPTNTADVLAGVANGTFALGFVEGLGSVAPLRERVVDHDELVLVVPPTHPWARRTSVSVAAVTDAALVQREQGSGTRVVFEEAMRRAGHEPAEPLLELTSVSSVRAAMLTSESPAVLSSMSVRDDLRRGTLVAVRIEDVTMPRALRAVWSRETELRGPARDLVDQAIRHGAARL